MLDAEIIYQALTLVVIAGAIDTMERLHPRFPVNRRYKIWLNIAALLVVIFGGQLWKPVIFKFFSAFDLPRMPLDRGLAALPAGVKILLGLIAADFSLYWVHRAMHRLNFLWPTHVFHHSIDELWWLSGSRTSLIHLLLFAIPQTVISYYILRLDPVQAGIAFSAGVVVNVWIHGNVSISLGRLDWLIITPNFHRIHHRAGWPTNMNLGFILTIWDRLFGTYIDPRESGDVHKLSAVPTQGRLPRMMLGF